MNQNRKAIFSDLYKQHASKMYGVCLRFTRNKEDAEDVMQEGFIRVYNSLESFRGESNILTWMQRIMINTAINFYRKKKTLSFSFFELEDDAPILEDKMEGIVEQLSATELLDVLNEMPDGYRMVFNLFSIEGYKHQEIAEMLGITEGTSKSQFRKARLCAQKLLEEKLSITRKD